MANLAVHIAAVRPAANPRQLAQSKRGFMPFGPDPDPEDDGRWDDFDDYDPYGFNAINDREPEEDDVYDENDPEELRRVDRFYDSLFEDYLRWDYPTGDESMLKSLQIEESWAVRTHTGDVRYQIQRCWDEYLDSPRSLHDHACSPGSNREDEELEDLRTEDDVYETPAWLVESWQLTVLDKNRKRATRRRQTIRLHKEFEAKQQKYYQDKITFLAGIYGLEAATAMVNVRPAHKSYRGDATRSNRERCMRRNKTKRLARQAVLWELRQVTAEMVEDYNEAYAIFWGLAA